MALTPEQVKELKAQLSEQIKNLPADKRAEAQKQIDDMSPEAIETMLKQQSGDSSSGQQVYRAIVSGQIPSKKIDENKQAIAVLDIKPISEGHTIIIPKSPITDAKKIPTQCFTLAKKVAKRISSKLKANSSEIQTQFLFGEIIINVIPIYDKTLNINSPRQEASEEKLSEIYVLLKAPPKRKPLIRKTKKANLQNSKIIKLSRRIP